MMKATGSISTFIKSRGWLWSFLVALLLAAQVGLGVHQLQHRLNSDAVASDDCKLCQFASHVTTGPEPIVILPPTLIVAEVLTLPTQDFFAVERPVAGFRSRAPPHAISI